MVGSTTGCRAGRPAGGDKARIKEAQLTAERNGSSRSASTAAGSTTANLSELCARRLPEYVRYHRSLRTFRTYRPFSIPSDFFVRRSHVDEVERQDLLDFSTPLHETGQKERVFTQTRSVVEVEAAWQAQAADSADWPASLRRAPNL